MPRSRAHFQGSFEFFSNLFTLYHCSGVEQPDLTYLLKQTEQLLKPRDSLLTESQPAAFPLPTAQLDKTKSDEHNSPSTALNQRGKINM